MPRPFMTVAAQVLEVRRSDEARTAPFWPRWMCTRWGAWLARHWAPAARLWRAEVKLAELAELDAREALAAVDAVIVLHLWAESDFSEPMDKVIRAELIAAWCKWRSCHVRKCAFVDCKPIGTARWVRKYES